MVLGVVRAHGGVIKVESTPGLGTAFRVFLPRVAREKREKQSPTTSQPHGECRSGTGMVLIVEDEDAIRIAVSKMLRMKGFSVIEAANGTVALELFQANVRKLDVVLLDMSLPGKSGCELLIEFRRIRSDVKVFMASAYSRDTIRNSLSGLQPSGYVQKPYQLNELVNLLQNSLSETQEAQHGKG